MYFTITKSSYETGYETSCSLSEAKEEQKTLLFPTAKGL